MAQWLSRFVPKWLRAPPRWPSQKHKKRKLESTKINGNITKAMVLIVFIVCDKKAQTEIGETLQKQWLRNFQFVFFFATHFKKH